MKGSSRKQSLSGDLTNYTRSLRVYSNLGTALGRVGEKTDEAIVASLESATG